MNQTPSKKTIILSDLGLFYSAAIWGSTFFIVKNALNGIDPITLVAYRFLIAGGIMSVYLIIKKKNIFDHFKEGLILSIILAALYIPQTIGLKYTTASNSGFITGLFVLFIPIFLLTIFKRKPTLMETAASVVSLSGLWFLTGGLTDFNIGDSITLIAAITYALHVLYSDKYMKAGIDPVIIAAQQFVLIGLISLAVCLIAQRPMIITTSYSWTAMLFLALFPTLSAFLIQMLAQRFTSAIKVSLIFALEPVFAAAFAWTLGNEQIVFHRAMGGLLIFIALLISALPHPKYLIRKLL